MCDCMHVESHSEWETPYLNDGPFACEAHELSNIVYCKLRFMEV